ncbi:hypothetical protein KKH18_12695 [bacterium]|nr:hypothetical protein [bacterium]
MKASRSLLLPGLLILLAIVASSTSIDPNDTWWHIRLGEYYLDNGEIPKVDVFSHTAAGARWYTHEWLSQVILYKTYDWFGFFGIRLLNTLMVSISILLLFRLFRKTASPLLPVLFGLAVIFPDFLGRCNTRPEIFTLPLTVAFLDFFMHRDRSVLPTLKPLAVIAVMAALWANLHGMALLGLLFLCAYTAGEFFTLLLQRYVKIPEWQSVSWTGVKGNCLIIAVYALAAMATPMGWGIYTHAFEGREFLPGPLGIMEWLSPFQFLGGILHSFLTHDFPWINIPLAWQFVFLAIPLAFLFSLPVLAARRQLPTLAEFFIVCFALYEAAAVVRFRWLFFVPLYFIIKAIRRPEPAAEKKATAYSTILSPLMILIIATGLVVLFSRGVDFKHPIRRDEYPIGIANFLEDAHSSGRLFNTYNWGGYFIFRLYPEYRVFIDGRTILYSTANRNLMLDHVVIDGKETGYEELLEQYKVDFLIATRRIYFPGPEIQHELDFIKQQQRSRTGGVQQFILEDPTPWDRFGVPTDSIAPDTTAMAPDWIPVLINREGSVYLRNAPDRARQMKDIQDFYAGLKIPFDSQSGPNLVTIIRDRPDLAIRYSILTKEMIEGVITGLENPESDDAIEAKVQLATTLIDLEFYRDGIAVMENVLEIDRYNESGLLQIARAYHLIGDNDKAYPYLERSISTRRSEAALAFLQHLRTHRAPRSNRPQALPPLDELAQGWKEKRF